MTFSTGMGVLSAGRFSLLDRARQMPKLPGSSVSQILEENVAYEFEVTDSAAVSHQSEMEFT